MYSLHPAPGTEEQRPPPAPVTLQPGKKIVMARFIRNDRPGGPWRVAMSAGEPAEVTANEEVTTTDSSVPLDHGKLANSKRRRVGRRDITRSSLATYNEGTARC